VTLHEPPELAALREQRAAGTTHHTIIVFRIVGIDNGWRVAIGAREFFRHSVSLLSFRPNLSDWHANRQRFALQ
jgi:hypothetical protein